ncbi:PREDICTED: uncharacterized protein LOC105542271 [Mandrillus leucophaeus]|uniref:uncharacterized protein LOC105542271 n=1 Tax=Mandrillus leucophaeus TaxID=9568 RepID=UPI0005F4E15C|nr:PREDICTED: uncharacterized protein LOC105542271 [Mandrillus leucophaeus]
MGLVAGLGVAVLLWKPRGGLISGIPQGILVPPAAVWCEKAWLVVTHSGSLAWVETPKTELSGGIQPAQLSYIEPRASRVGFLETQVLLRAGEHEQGSLWEGGRGCGATQVVEAELGLGTLVPSEASPVLEAVPKVASCATQVVEAELGLGPLVLSEASPVLEAVPKVASCDSSLIPPWAKYPKQRPGQGVFILVPRKHMQKGSACPRGLPEVRASPSKCTVQVLAGREGFCKTEEKMAAFRLLPGTSSGLQSAPSLTRAGPALPEAVSPSHVIADSADPAEPEKEIPGSWLPGLMMRHQGCWRGNEGAPVARETGEGVCAGNSANTVCAGVRAASPLEESPPLPLSGDGGGGKDSARRRRRCQHFAPGTSSGLQSAPSLTRAGPALPEAVSPSHVIADSADPAGPEKGIPGSWLPGLMMRHQGCWRGNEGAPVAWETWEGVCAGLSANTVCAGLTAASPLEESPPLPLSGDGGRGGERYEKILKLTADVKFGSGDVKATVAVLSFILPSVAKHSVDGGSLSSELQQLGLPKEHAASLCHCYEEKQSPLQKHLRVCSLRSKYETSQGSALEHLEPKKLPLTFVIPGTPSLIMKNADPNPLRCLKEQAPSAVLQALAVAIPLEVQRNLVPATVNPDVTTFLPALFDVLVLAAVFGQPCKSSPWGSRREEAPGCVASSWTLALSGSEFLGKSVVLELRIHSSALRHCLWKPWDKVKEGAQTQPDTHQDKGECDKQEA